MERELSLSHSPGTTVSPLRHTSNSLNGGDVETVGLSACDACYTRKIKCDRKSSCSNCVDSNSLCLRRRQKQQRKPRENVSSKLNETRQEMEARMASLENTITMMGASKYVEASTKGTPKPFGSNALTPRSESELSGPNRQKRTNSTAFKENSTNEMSSFNMWNTYTADTSNATPLFSAVEAQSMIQQVLDQGSRLSKQKREAFHSALGTLSESLNTSYNDASSMSANTDHLVHAQEWWDNPAIPDVEAVQWMLQPGETDDILWSLPDGLPLITAKSAIQMSIDIRDTQKRKSNPAWVVCVNTLVAHFLLQKLMSAKTKNGLEGSIQNKITAYFATSQQALSQINILAAPCLQNIQALVFGAFNAQEAGHPMDSWKLNTAAANLCIVLNLHKRLNHFSNAPSETTTQAKYCFFICYINDKGLAMNLGKPPSIPDAYMEVSLHELVPPMSPPFRQYLQDQMLELAIVQSAIIDLQATKSKMTPQELDLKVSKIARMMDKVGELIHKISNELPAFTAREDLQFEMVLGKFSFYTIKTVLYHSCIDINNKGKYMNHLLAAARASMEEMREMRDNQANFNQYKVHSFAHWSVLYYPFTSFFVLFCNVISKKYLPDYELMLAFVEYLRDAKSTSAPVTKLYNLCLPFCALASTALKDSTDGENSDSVRPSKRQKPATSTSDHQEEVQETNANIPPQNRTTVVPNEQQDVNTPISQQGFEVGATAGAGAVEPDMMQNNLEDNFFAQFMDFQPRLQWLDTDFSAFEETWGQTGFGGGLDGVGYPDFQ